MVNEISVLGMLNGSKFVKTGSNIRGGVGGPGRSRVSVKNAVEIHGYAKIKKRFRLSKAKLEQPSRWVLRPLVPSPVGIDENLSGRVLRLLSDRDPRECGNVPRRCVEAWMG